MLAEQLRRPERKPVVEESPDTVGLGGREIRPGETRGKVPQKHTAQAPGYHVNFGAGKVEMVR
jgi:hypothetical protein